MTRLLFIFIASINFLWVAVSLRNHNTRSINLISKCRLGSCVTYTSGSHTTDCLKGILIGSILGGFVSTTNAQIPTMDAYEFGSGSKIITDKNKNIPTKGALTLRELSSGKLNEFILESMPYVNGCKWDNVRDNIARYKIIRTPLFGSSSLQQLSNYLGTSPTLTKQIEESREELSFMLGQLDDYSLSNRVVFFNSEDLKQINVIANRDVVNAASSCDATGQASIEEPLAILNSAADIAGDIDKLVSSGTK